MKSSKFLHAGAHIGDIFCSACMYVLQELADLISFLRTDGNERLGNLEWCNCLISRCFALPIDELFRPDTILSEYVAFAIHLQIEGIIRHPLLQRTNQCFVQVSMKNFPNDILDLHVERLLCSHIFDVYDLYQMY